MSEKLEIRQFTESTEKQKAFDDFYTITLKPKLIAGYASDPECLDKIIRRFEHMVDYNVPHGKKLRGLCVYESFLNLIENEKEKVDTKLIEQAKAIGWCVEFLQASFLVADDIMDNSTYRRGQPCWYLTKDVGNIAINDSFYLLACVFKIINEFLSSHSMYSKFYEIFSQSLMNTVIGQGLDLITPPKTENETDIFDFHNYTQEQYYSIVKWKTAYYSFCLPVQSALYLAEIDDKKVHAKCRDILLEMGCFFQIQDDYLDCYGDPKITGKVGTDIEESKCSWLVIQALNKSSVEQRECLKKYYGQNDQSSVAQIKKVFKDLNLDEEYKKFEQDKYEEIMSGIGNLLLDSTNVSELQVEKIKNTLRLYAKKIFKRNK